MTRITNAWWAQREHILNDRSLDEFDRGYQLARYDVEIEVAALRAENAALREETVRDNAEIAALRARCEELSQRLVDVEALHPVSRERD